VALALAASTGRATVDLTLVNSYPLLDGSRSTPLEEIVSADDLAQSLLVGPNGVIDPPTLMDAAGGNEAPAYASRGDTSLATAASNQSAVSIVPRAGSAAGSVSVRFRDFNPAANADFHGDPMLLSLTSGTASAIALQDVAALALAPDSAIEAPGLEPSSVFLLGVIVLAVGVYLKGDLTASAARTGAVL
jgi:hypothetical protein